MKYFIYRLTIPFICLYNGLWHLLIGLLMVTVDLLINIIYIFEPKSALKLKITFKEEE